MKKSKKLILCSLLACSVLSFTACVAPSTYLITASSSDNSFGRVSGAKTEEMDEGTKITLTASETESQTHPFICWVKDYNKVYSTEKELQLVYSEETQGHYTAVYEEEASKMLFATLSSIRINASNYTNCAYTLSYSSSASGSNNFMTFMEGTFDSGNQINTDHSSVFYFGPLGSVVDYKFQVALALTNAQGEISNHNINFTTKVNNSSFQETSLCEISGVNESQEINISLSFEKISYDMYHSAEQL